MLRACGGNVNARVTSFGSGRSTVLFCATEQNHCDVVGYLLGQPWIEVDKATTDDGSTPLYNCCTKGVGDVVKQLLAAKADVNKAATGGWTPLGTAKDEGHTLSSSTCSVLLAESKQRGDLSCQGRLK